MARPTLSLVVLQHGRHDLTRRCLLSLAEGTRASHEIVLVDNGSPEPVPAALHDLADTVIHLEANRGFSVGMNEGAAACTGSFVAFVNNDTRFPSGWDDLCLEHFRRAEVGAVYPAVTAAGVARSVRAYPGPEPELLSPFERPPSAVVVVMRRHDFADLGGWNEGYSIASGEDADLAFTVWLNDLEIVLEARVLIDHVGKATTMQVLPNWRRVWHENGLAFLERWAGPSTDQPRVAACSIERWDRNRRTARSASIHMLELQACRDRREWRSFRRVAGRLTDSLRQLRS